MLRSYLTKPFDFFANLNEISCVKRTGLFLMIAAYLCGGSLSSAVAEPQASTRIVYTHSHSHDHDDGHGQHHHHEDVEEAASNETEPSSIPGDGVPQEHSHELVVSCSVSIDFKPATAFIRCPEEAETQLFIAGKSPVFDSYRLSIFRPPILS
jgi:hypothetical protein